jgi:intraflagellar transport protein 122
VSIRDKEGNEKVKIERKSPIWTLSWNPSKDEPCDILAVGDWGQVSRGFAKLILKK